MKRDPEMACTRCGRFVDAGAGNQCVDAEGEPQRLCWACWRKANDPDRPDPRVVGLLSEQERR